MSNTDKNQNNTSATLPHVSVVIISKNRTQSARQAVEKLKQIDYPPDMFEIVLLEETDSPSNLFSDISYHSMPVRNRGFAFARNEAVKHAKHDIIAFIDDDCIVDKAWLRELIKPLVENEDVLAVCGSVFVPACGRVGQCENILGFPGGGMRYFHKSKNRIMKRASFSTCNCAVRKAAIEKAGGFDERLELGGEDDMLSRKIGETGAILYNPRAVVYHAPRDNIIQVFKWFVRRGKARADMVTVSGDKAHEIFDMAKNSPFVRFSLTVFILWLLKLPVIPAIILLVTAHYAFILVKFRWARAYYQEPGTFLIIPAVKFVMDCGFDAGLCIRGLRNSGLKRSG